jgi:hypothetical protein
MLFIVSDVALNVGAGEGGTTVQVEIERAPGVKCERCWRFVPSVRTEPQWSGICDRCVGASASRRLNVASAGVACTCSSRDSSSSPIRP